MKTKISLKITLIFVVSLLLISTLPLGVLVALSVLDKTENNATSTNSISCTHAPNEHLLQCYLKDSNQDMLQKTETTLLVSWKKLEDFLAQSTSEEELSYIRNFWSNSAKNIMDEAENILEQQDEESFQKAYDIGGIILVLMFLFIIYKRIKDRWNKDSLTKLYNRTHLLEDLKSRIKLYKRMKNPFCIIFITIDNLNHIGEAYGEEKEEHILKNFASTAKKMLRDDDSIFRYSDEEFVILAKSARTEEAYNLAERLRTRIEAFDFELIEVVTLSIGISEFYEEQNMSGLITCANEAMSQSKENGRNKTSIYQS